MVNLEKVVDDTKGGRERVAATRERMNGMRAKMTAMRAAAVAS
jgi:hypothetical protein